MAGATRTTRSPAPRDDATNDGSLVGDDEILPLRPSPSLSPQRPPNALAPGSLRGVRVVSWTPDEREFLCAAYVEATLNAEVGIDQRLETFKEDICSRFRARLPNDMPRVERRRSRSTSAIHKELSYNIFPMVDRFKNSYMAIVNYRLTGNPTMADLFNATLAKLNGLSPYEGFKPEVAAKLDNQPLRLWNILKQLDRFSGAATMEALGRPRRVAHDDAEEDTVEDDPFDEPQSSTYDRSKKQRRQGAFQERPIGTKAAKEFSRIEAALQRESVAHTAALNSIARSAAERSTVAFWSSPMAANTEEGRAWWAREASRRLREEPDGHPVANNANTPDANDEAAMQREIDAASAAAAAIGRGRRGRGSRGGGGRGRDGSGRGRRGGTRGRRGLARGARGGRARAERRGSRSTSEIDEEEAGSVTETESDASPAPHGHAHTDKETAEEEAEEEDHIVSPPPPPPSTLPVPTTSIEDAADAAVALAAAATQGSSSDSGHGNTRLPADESVGASGEHEQVSTGGEPRGRSHGGRAGVSSSRPPLPPSLRTASNRGRSSIVSKQRLFMERAHANGLNIDQRVLNTMDWGSSSDGEDGDEHDDVDDA